MIENNSIDNIIQVEGNSLTLTVGDYVLTLKIEPRQPAPSGKLKYGPGRTLFDLVLEAARHSAGTLFPEQFTAANLYHIARNLHPEMDIRRNSWNSHVMSSAPNHGSYHHYSAHRDYFRYHGNGKYTLDTKWSINNIHPNPGDSKEE